jgi:hypothetical protein
MIIDQSFCQAYECKLVDAPPTGGVPMYCYPGGIVGGWVRGVGVEITPHSTAECWIGSFADGSLSPRAASGAFSHPCPNKLLVVAKGDGYVVNVNDPREFSRIDRSLPIMGVIPLPDAGVIVLYDFTGMVAIGAGGIVWETPRLSWDGLTIEGVLSGVIRGTGWDSANNCNVHFEVIASSGECKGGASPQLL